MTSFGGLAGDQAIAMSAPASSKWPHHHFCFRRLQGGGRMATSQPRDAAWLKACNSQWEANTSQQESWGGIRTKNLRWAATSETKERAQPRPAVPLVSCLAFARPLCESKTCRPAPKTSPCFQDFHCHIPSLWGSLFLVSCTVKFTANQLVRSVEESLQYCCG